MRGCNGRRIVRALQSEEDRERCCQWDPSTARASPMGPEPTEDVASGAAVSVADRSSTSEKSNLAPVRAIDTALVRAAASSQLPPHYHHHLATRTARWTSSSYSRRCSCGAMSAHVGRYPAKPLSSRHQTTPPPHRNSNPPPHREWRRS